MKDIAIKAIHILIILLVATTSITTYAKETVDKTIDVDENSYIEIIHVNGSANIVGWDQNKVQVKGELGERTEEFIFERDGNSVLIEVKVKNNSGWNWGKNSNDDGDKLDIFVPIKSRVEYSSVNAGVTVDNINGEADIRVINGEIRAQNLLGLIQLDSVNGDIFGKDLNGEISLNSVNGEIKGEALQGDELNATVVNGEIDLKSTSRQISVDSVNGEIDVEAQDVGDAQMNTVNGSISFDMNLMENGKVEASSVSGSIRLGFQSNVNASFDIAAHAGGSIKNRLTDDEPTKAKYGPRRSLEFSTGEPNAHVDVSTVSGRVEIRPRS